jgi:hypothetical protein
MKSDSEPPNYEQFHGYDAPLFCRDVQLFLTEKLR